MQRYFPSSSGTAQDRVVAVAGPRPRLLRGSLRQDQRVLSLGQGVAAVPLHHLLLQRHLPADKQLNTLAP